MFGHTPFSTSLYVGSLASTVKRPRKKPEREGTEPYEHRHSALKLRVLFLREDSLGVKTVYLPQ